MTGEEGGWAGGKPSEPQKDPPVNGGSGMRGVWFYSANMGLER